MRSSAVPRCTRRTPALRTSCTTTRRRASTTSVAWFRCFLRTVMTSRRSWRPATRSTGSARGSWISCLRIPGLPMTFTKSSPRSPRSPITASSWRCTSCGPATSCVPWPASAAAPWGLSPTSRLFARVSSTSTLRRRPPGSSSCATRSTSPWSRSSMYPASCLALIRSTRESSGMGPSCCTRTATPPFRASKLSSARPTDRKSTRLNSSHADIYTLSLHDALPICLDQEHQGIIRHGAKLLYAYCDATVPRVQVILRKAYGGACIVMDSRSIGADLSFAWPANEIAVMGAEAAAGVIHHKKLADASRPDQLRDRLITEYKEELMHPYYASERGLVDDVIDPRHTRT